MLLRAGAGDAARLQKAEEDCCLLVPRALPISWGLYVRMGLSKPCNETSHISMNRDHRNNQEGQSVGSCFTPQALFLSLAPTSLGLPGLLKSFRVEHLLMDLKVKFQVRTGSFFLILLILQAIILQEPFLKEAAPSTRASHSKKLCFSKPACFLKQGQSSIFKVKKTQQKNG